jgi:CRISPR/Cas system-associated endoribonuclease Cas2
MSYIIVYFTTGEVIDFTDVVDRRRVWRRVSKICKRWGSRVAYVFELCDCTSADLNKLYGRIPMHGMGVDF